MYFSLILLVLLLTNCECRMLYENIIVEKCCNGETFECCMESLTFKKPLNCMNISNTRRAIIEDCLHIEMYPYEKNPYKSIDKTCCHVFTGNMYDPDDICYNTCTTVLQKYFLPNSEKRTKIKSCIVKNPVFNCFNKCVKWSSKNGYDRFDFEDNCNVLDKVKPGYVYVGKEIDD
uniref:DB domain-containing protein n=1 Tax=Strongyloides venezuelensis TaxID=75913 RepID=A0A0K0FH06_STRVS